MKIKDLLIKLKEYPEDLEVTVFGQESERPELEIYFEFWSNEQLDFLLLRNDQSKKEKRTEIPRLVFKRSVKDYDN